MCLRWCGALRYLNAIWAYSFYCVSYSRFFFLSTKYGPVGPFRGHSQLLPPSFLRYSQRTTASWVLHSVPLRSALRLVTLSSTILAVSSCSSFSLRDAPWLPCSVALMHELDQCFLKSLVRRIPYNVSSFCIIHLQNYLSSRTQRAHLAVAFKFRIFVNNKHWLLKV